VRSAFLGALALALVGCAGNGDGDGDRGPALVVVGDDPTDVPIDGISDDLLATFRRADALFDKAYREPQGLGPLYIRRACTECHAGGLRGPGRVQKMVVVDESGAPALDQSALFDHTVRPYTAAGATRAAVPPDASALAAGESIRVTTRLPASVLGRGFIDAVDDAEILRVEAEQKARGDGISGRVNRVAYGSVVDLGGGYHAYGPGDVDLIGRFGHKAIVASVEDFVARALQLDIGLTSPLRPDELANADGLADDDKPGVDVGEDVVRDLATYVRLLAIPAREAGHERGEALFHEVKCAVCHVPSMHTRADYPIAALAGIDAPIYSDLLLHERGESYDDGLVEGDAGTSEWRTAPLIGLRFFTSYLHDGSAHSILDVIATHAVDGSESKVAADAFFALSDDDQQALLDFVQSL
jgi:CxxC motif-containing protein (DUF1111 family)